MKFPVIARSAVCENNRAANRAATERERMGVEKL